MRLEYRLRFADYLLFNAVHQFLSGWMQLFLLLLAWLMYLLLVEDLGRDMAIGAGVLFYLAMWMFQLVFNVLYLYSSKNKSLLTNHVVEVRDDAFYDETRFNQSLHFWPGIAKVVRRPGFAAVYINAVAAHIIPRRAFVSDEQMTEFVAMVRERMRAAKQQGSA